MSKFNITKNTKTIVSILTNISKKPPLSRAVWLSNRRVFTEYSTNLLIVVAKLALVWKFSNNNH